jgi:hypothetical protein
LLDLFSYWLSEILFTLEKKEGRPTRLGVEYNEKLELFSYWLINILFTLEKKEGRPTRLEYNTDNPCTVVDGYLLLLVDLDPLNAGEGRKPTNKSRVL